MLYTLTTDIGKKLSRQACIKTEGGRMGGRREVRTILMMVMFICTSVTAMAQQANGTISGTVQDVSGAVIPGVTVTLSSVGLIGGNQTSVSDERGVYRFT